MDERAYRRSKRLAARLQPLLTKRARRKPAGALIYPAGFRSEDGMAYDLEGAHRVAHEAAKEAAKAAREGAPHAGVRIISRAYKRAYEEKYRKVQQALRE